MFNVNDLKKLCKNSNIFYDLEECVNIYGVKHEYLAKKLIDN